MYNIDFVIPWVDGNDVAWQKEKNKYMSKERNEGNAENRFRDWNNLKYWFRAVEKYAPWVNKVYLITWGHIPNWLNMNHSKLKIVKHEDFIPQEYLPTFNSCVIELNLWRIRDLSEYFVLFNDDVFLNDYVEKEYFFEKGKPKDMFALATTYVNTPDEVYGHIMLNDIGIINHHFDKRETFKSNWKKWFNLHYGSKNIMTACLLPFKYFCGFYSYHLAYPYLKSVFKKVWDQEPEAFDKMMYNKFREWSNLSPLAIRAWNLCEGNFIPAHRTMKGYFDVGNNNIQEICDYIRKKKSKIICINDCSGDFNFENAVQKINEAFSSVLPQKSSYEL